MQEIVKQLWSAFQPLFPMLISVLIAFIGYTNYLRQREHELVRKRYLDEGVDLLISRLDEILSIFRHNLNLSATVLKKFREFGPIVDNTYLKDIRAVDQGGMSITAVHRFKLLVNDNCVWDGLQEAFAFVVEANAFFCDDLLEACGEQIRGNITKDQIADQYMELVLKREQESHVHYMFISELLMLATILEQSKFTFKSISRFHKLRTVKATIDRIKKLVPLEAQTDGVQNA